MFKTKNLFTVLVTLFLSLVVKSAAAETCYVTNPDPSFDQGTLMHAVASQEGAGGTGTPCNTIKFDISGVIEIPSQVHINSKVTLDGNNKVTLKPVANFDPDVDDGCLVRVVHQAGRDGETREGFGLSSIKNIMIDASGLDHGLCLYSNMNDMNNILVKNAVVNGITIFGDDNDILNSGVYSNGEGLVVNGGIENLITRTRFWDNDGIGISLTNNGNNNLQQPENVVAIRDTNNASSYILIGTVESDTDILEVFEADADDREGRSFLSFFKTNNSLLLNLGNGRTAFANKVNNLRYSTIASADDIVMTATVTIDTNTGTTSQFSLKARKFTGNVDDCFDKVDLLDIYAADPTANPCVEEDKDEICDDGIDNDLDGDIDCEDSDCADAVECKEICDDHIDNDNDGQIDCDDEDCIDDPNCITAPCPDEDNDTICDDEDNCLSTANPGQVDADGDGRGDLCDPFLNTLCADYFNIVNNPDSTEEEKSEAVDLFIDCCEIDPNNEQVCQDGKCLILTVMGLIFGDMDRDGVLDQDDNCIEIANGPCKGTDNQQDTDGDGIGDVCDNCPTVANPGQEDTFGDVAGDACESGGWDFRDEDHDGIINRDDDCPFVPDPNQEDLDGDGFGDACDPDMDNDGVNNFDDNCPAVENSRQLDTDGDGLGDECDPVTGAIINDDLDGDGVPNEEDNCIIIPNPDQEDVDNNGIGDACQIDALIPDEDLDGDTITNHEDNCPAVDNPDQIDTDGDGVGDLCDFDDIDGDGILNINDNCPTISNGPNTEGITDEEIQLDSNNDGIGDACANILNADDLDGDGVLNQDDNCILVFNPAQDNSDGDSVGDACDSADDNRINEILINVKDLDEDGTNNSTDNCPLIANPDQADADNDGIGDLCEGWVYSGDLDGDLIPDHLDNCITVRNPLQEDSDGDGIGDRCESEINLGDVDLSDIDGDGVLNIRTTTGNPIDNCPVSWNPLQIDSDSDNIGDVCDLDSIFLPEDEDLDGDGVLNRDDNCPAIKNPGQEDSDGNNIGDACQLIVDLDITDDGDFDGDGIPNKNDNCPTRYNPDQMDTDKDGIGDICDLAVDIDGAGSTPPSGGLEIVGGPEAGCSIIASNTMNFAGLILLILPGFIAVISRKRLIK